jgi:hypothetical protein
VDTALNALRTGKTKVVSGFANYVGTLFGGYLPNKVTTRVMAKALRSRFQRDK